MLRRSLLIAVLVGSWAAWLSSPAQAAWSVDGWGANHYGQLGDGTKSGPERCGVAACSRTPVPASGLSEVVTAVAAGGSHTLALQRNGTVMAWGENEFGQLGNGTTRDSDVPVQVCEAHGCAKPLTGVVAVAAGHFQSYALLNTGKVVAWGINGKGQLGNGTSSGPETCAHTAIACSTTPVEVSGLTEAAAIASGYDHGLALLRNHEVKAWGNNQYGQLGDGTSTGPETCGGIACSTSPVAVQFGKALRNGHYPTAIAGGNAHSLALISSGTVWAWGENAHGQLGDGATTNTAVPVEVCAAGGVDAEGECGYVSEQALGDVTAIAAGEGHSLALQWTGAVMAWGLNNFGQLGNGTTTSRSNPVEVTGLGAAVTIAAGQYHSLALLRNGAAAAWGLNSEGQLGNGTTTSSSAPVYVTNPPGGGAFDPGAGTMAAGGAFSEAVVTPPQCNPAKPAKEVKVTSNSSGTLAVSWELEAGTPSPSREWVMYSSEREAIQTYGATPELENGTARSAELKNLHPGEPYDVVLALEYGSCVEDRLEGNDHVSGWSLAPTFHFYHDLSTEGRAGPGEPFKPGTKVTLNFNQFGTHSWTDLQTIKGNTANYVYCNKLDADWYFVEPEKETERVTWTLTKWTPSECTQKGYCPQQSEPVGLELNPLPLEGIDTYGAYNGYRFSHIVGLSFTVTCNGKAVAKIVESKQLNHGVLEGYWSNGDYTQSVPPDLDMGDGGQYGQTYGNAGDMELEGSGGQQVIQPSLEWYYLGYEGFAGQIIPHG